MNIGINIVGISFGSRNRDWKETKDSIKKNIIECWDGHSVSTYITTYDSETVSDLIEYYSPKKHQILSLDGSDQRLTYKKSLENLRDEDLDFIISTRFDIDFFNPISKMSMDLDKFNILFNESGYPKYVCDNFFGFPKKHLEAFIESTQDMYDKPARAYCADLHDVKNVIEGKINGHIHIVSKDEQLSNNNSFYTLKRQ